MNRARVLLVAGMALLPAAMHAADLGPRRGICIGTEAECRAQGEQSAQTGIDLFVTFELNSAELTPDALAKLPAIAAELQTRALRGRNFVVEGFTDARGTEARNALLSRLRAEAVRAFLLRAGVERSRLSAVGRGASNFRVADPFDPINRRVELRLAAP